MNQREAFLRQASSDLLVSEHLRDQTQFPACHWLHYLQMATEKLAKAIRLTPAGGSSFRQSHVVFSKLTPILRRQVSVAASLHMHPDTYRGFIDQTTALRADIEALAPDIAGSRPNAEYPWLARKARGELEWFAPSAWNFDLERKLRAYPGRSLLKLVSVLSRDFERLF